MGRRPKLAIAPEQISEEIEVVTDPLPVPSIPEMPKPFEPREMALGDRTFLIAPISKRRTPTSFDDAGDFALEAIPLIKRMFGMVMTGNLDLELKDEDISNQNAIMNLITTANEQEFESLMRDMKNRLPRLVSMACQISIQEVKELAGSPLNTQLLEIAFAQIMADNILESVLGLTAGFGLSGSAAAGE